MALSGSITSDSIINIVINEEVHKQFIMFSPANIAKASNMHRVFGDGLRRTGEGGGADQTNVICTLFPTDIQFNKIISFKYNVGLLHINIQTSNKVNIEFVSRYKT